MSSAGQILDLERLLEEDLSSFFPEALPATIHLDAFEALNVDGQTLLCLQGKALATFLKQYREGRAPLFTPLFARFTLCSAALKRPMAIECSLYGIRRPLPPEGSSLKPFLPFLLQALAKKTVLSL